MDLNSCKENSSREREKKYYEISHLKNPFSPTQLSIYTWKKIKLVFFCEIKKKKDTDEDEENSKKKEVED